MIKKATEAMFWTDQVHALQHRNPNSCVFAQPNTISFMDLVDDSEASRAGIRQLVLEWAAAERRVRKGIPAECGDLLSHEYEDSNLFVKVQGDADHWHFHAECTEGNGRRVWVIQVMLSCQDGLCRVGVRNAFATTTDYIPSYECPSIIPTLVQSGLMVDADFPISSEPTRVYGYDSIEALMEFVKDESRVLPILLFSPYPGKSHMPMDHKLFAEQNQGTAHIFTLTPWAENTMRRKYGQDIAVFGGGVRIFRPLSGPFIEKDHPVLSLKHIAGKSRTSITNKLRRLSFGQELHLASMFERWQKCERPKSEVPL